MDDSPFDGLTRAFGQGTTRRSALGLIAAAAALGLREVSAKARRRKGKSQGKSQDKGQGLGKSPDKGLGTAQPPGRVRLQPGTDLTAAIHSAAKGATLQLCPGTWQLSETVLIDNDITLVGASTKGASDSNLSGRGRIQVIGIRPGVTVTLQNLTITNGDAYQGAGIFNQGNLTLVDCAVTNSAATFGGGIYNQGVLYVVRGGISGNWSGYTNNSPYWGGAGIFNDGSCLKCAAEVTIEGTVITRNMVQGDSSAYPGYGGAIYNGYQGQVTIKSGSITRNVAGALIPRYDPGYDGRGIASGYGGGIYSIGNKLTVDGGTISGNFAAYGGGLYSETGGAPWVSIANETIIDLNEPTNCDTGDVPVTNCVG
jgi:hypothetical protein